MNFRKESMNQAGQKLTEFPKEVFERKKLYKLDLSNNNIKHIPKEIDKLRYLESLNLSGNRIRHLFAKLFELPRLKILILNNNEIINLPKQVGKVQTLKILNLANNNISNLPPEIASLCNLVELNLTGNSLNDFPVVPNGFKNLKALWLSHNPLGNISANDLLSNIPTLRSLYCYSPRLENRITNHDEYFYLASSVKGNSQQLIKKAMSDVKERKEKKNVVPLGQEQLDPKTDNAKFFISYSHADKEYLNRLKTHLKVLKHDVSFDVWVDTDIKTGDKWEKKIKEALESATCAILLISTEFLASDYIQKNELPPLLKDADEKGTKIFPVIVHPCRFSKIKSLSQFQAANSPSEPLSTLTFPNQEFVFLKLCNDIQAHLEQDEIAS